MLRACPALLALSLLSCGPWFGDSGNSEAKIPDCTTEEVPLVDLSLIPTGFERSPAQLLAPATGVFEGTLELEGGLADALPDGTEVPLTIEVEIEPGQVRAVYDSASANCAKPRLKAKVTLTIDAGATLSGTVQGELAVQASTEISSQQSFTDFETTLRPMFDGEIAEGPTLVTSLTVSADGAVRGSIYLVAEVTMPRCNQTQTTCAGSSVVGEQDRPIGSVTVQQRSMP